MQLALVGPYPAPWGGISVHVRALHGLARRTGLPVEVLDVGEGHARRTGDGGVRDAGSYARFAAELARTARRRSLPHVHVPGNNAKAWVVALAAGAARRGGLLTVHSGLAPALLARSPAVRCLAARACDAYEHVLCANEEIAAALEDAGVGAGRLEVVPAFVAGGLEPGRPPLAAVRARARFAVLLAAALAPGPVYGADVLLEAIAQLARGRPDLGCVVWGAGTDDRAFAEDLRGRGLERSVVALGEIDHPSSLGAMRIADAFVRPTRADGDSVSVREALALGVRVVASAVGHRPPGVVRFRAGDADDLAAAIERALAEPPPAPRAPDDASGRILAAWRGVGLQVPMGRSRP